MAMAKPKKLVAVHGVAPHRTVLCPTFRCFEYSLEQPLRYPPVVRDEWEIDVN